MKKKNVIEWVYIRSFFGIKYNHIYWMQNYAHYTHIHNCILLQRHLRSFWVSGQFRFKYFCFRLRLDQNYAGSTKIFRDWFQMESSDSMLTGWNFFSFSVQQVKHYSALYFKELLRRCLRNRFRQFMFVTAKQWAITHSFMTHFLMTEIGLLRMRTRGRKNHAMSYHRFHSDGHAWR